MPQATAEDWGTRHAAVIDFVFIGLNGKKARIKAGIAASTEMVQDNEDFEVVFMPSVNSYANTVASALALLSSANVDVSITFTNPYALVNANFGDYGTGDIHQAAQLTVWLDAEKTANVFIPAPVQTIFMSTDGPGSDIINLASATSGLLLPFMEALASVPDNSVVPSLWVISDFERVDDTKGSNGLKFGKKVRRKYLPNSLA